MTPLPVRRLLLSLAVAAAAAVAAAPSAGAATVAREGDALVFRGAPGERNHVYLNESFSPAGRLRISDARGITALPESCTRRDVDLVDCDVPGRVRVELGDEDDSAAFQDAWAFSILVDIDGGGGDDRLDGLADRAQRERLDGGPGKDVISGFGGDDDLRGGAGDDDLDGGEGDDAVRGEDGDDELAGDGQAAPGADLVDGGAGSDQVREYVEAGIDVHPPAGVSLDGQPDDGRPGEGDNVVSIERFTAYVSGRFVLSDGPEVWQVWANMNSGESEVLALGGDDTVTGGDAIETIDGGAGDDRLEGGKNHDTIAGGPGADLIYGDETSDSCDPEYPESCVRYGNDVILARDGEVDGIDCGAGQDRVEADRSDVVAENCETVELAAQPEPAPVTPVEPVKPIEPVEPGRAPALTVGARKLRAALARGLSVKLTGAAPGRATVTARHGRRIVGRGSARVGASGRATVKVRFTKAARRALRGKRKVTLGLRGGGARLTVRLAR